MNILASSIHHSSSLYLHMFPSQTFFLYFCGVQLQTPLTRIAMFLTVIQPLCDLHNGVLKFIPHNFHIIITHPFCYVQQCDEAHSLCIWASNNCLTLSNHRTKQLNCRIIGLCQLLQNRPIPLRRHGMQHSLIAMTLDLAAGTGSQNLA